MQAEIPTDAELLEGLKNGEPGTFETLFNRHWQELYKKAYRRLRDQTEAEDMIQDIFTSIWDRRYSLEINNSLEGYLHNSLKYKIIKWIERKNLFEEASSHLLHKMEEIENTIFDTMAASDVKKTLDDAVQSFPENMRKIFMLRAENYSISEIALALGLAEQTVKNNTTEALRRLKVSISAQHPDLNKSFLAALAALMVS